MPLLQDTFSLTVQGLRDVPPHELVAQISKVFSVITTLNADQAVAAYQTLSFIGATTPAPEAQNAAKHLKAAVALQMDRLRKNPELNIDEMVKLKRRFDEVREVG